MARLGSPILVVQRVEKPSVEQAIKIIGAIAAMIAALFVPHLQPIVIEGVLYSLFLGLVLISLILGSRAAPLWRKAGIHFAPPDMRPVESAPPPVVVILHDPSTEEIANSIKKNHEVPDLCVETAVIDLTATDVQAMIPPSADTADALYFVWSDAMGSKEATLDALDAWSWSHIHVPVLLVRPTNVVIDERSKREIAKHKFSMIPLEDAQPRAILVQSILRMKGWLTESRQLRKFWNFARGLSAAALIALAFVTTRYVIVNEEIYDRDTVMEPELTTVVSQLANSRRRYEKLPAPVQMNDDLTSVGRVVLAGLCRLARVEPGQMTLSVFRRVGDELREVDRDVQKPVTLKVGASTAGCSVEHSSFMLWEKKCKPGSPAAWSKFDREIGHVVLVNNGKVERCYIKLDGLNGDLCDYDEHVGESLGNTGVLCFSPETETGPSDTAVCLVMHIDDTRFLDSRVARAALHRYALVANSIPTNALLPNQSGPPGSPPN